MDALLDTVLSHVPPPTPEACTRPGPERRRDLGRERGRDLGREDVEGWGCEGVREQKVCRRCVVGGERDAGPPGG